MTREWRAGRRWRALRAVLPSRTDYIGIPRSWKGDLIAGLTVGVIALPLALGFGVASGVGARAGLITAIVAGLVAAVFGGSSSQVSGPTGAMAVVLAPIVLAHGRGSVALVALMAGIILLAMSAAGAGRLIQFVPWSVLEGFTLGIAITIALQQMPLILGEPGPSGGGVLRGAWFALAHASAGPWAISLLLAGSVVLIMVTWSTFTPALPSSIVAVALVSVTAWLLNAKVPTIGSLPSHLPMPSFPALHVTLVRQLFGPAFAVATLAALESLLSARVADGMSGTTSSDQRELFGQGLANVAAGLFGGMPATGAIARTAVNVRSGAKTRVAAVTHSLVIVVVLLTAATVVANIPLAVLGGVLIVTAASMVHRARIAAVLSVHTSERLVFGVTALITVAVNLVTAVEVGILAAGILALRSIAAESGATKEDLADHHDGPVDETALLAEHIAIYRLDGALFFGAVPRFEADMARTGEARVVILRCKGLSHLDASGAAALARISEAFKRRGVTLLVKGASLEHGRMMEAAGILGDLERRGHLFDDLDAAIAHAHRHLQAEHLRGGDADAA